MPSTVPLVQTPSALHVEDSQRSRISLLVIEDEPGSSRMVGRILQRAGYKVTIAEGGSAGLAALDKETFTVIVTDLFMPEHDGFEILRAARRQAPTSKTLLMSGSPRLKEIDYLRIAKHLGADAALEKPFEVRELLDAIAGLVGDPAALSPPDPR